MHHCLEKKQMQMKRYSLRIDRFPGSQRLGRLLDDWSAPFITPSSLLFQSLCVALT